MNDISPMLHGVALYAHTPNSERQLEIERLGCETAQQQFARTCVGTERDPALLKVLKTAVGRMAPEFDRLITPKYAHREHKRRGRELLQELVARTKGGPSKLNGETVAWVSASTVLAACREVAAKASVPHATLCRRITKQLLCYAQIGDYAQAEGESGRLYLRNMMRDFDTRSEGTEARKTLLRRFVTESSGISVDDVNPASAVHLGGLCLGVVLKLGGFAESVCIQESKRKRTSRYQMLPEVANWITDVQDAILQFKAMRLPMVVEPVPWNSRWSNGPYALKANAVKFVRTKTWESVCRDQLIPEDADWSQSLDACTRLGSVPYRVHERVLDTLAWVLEDNGGGLAGLPTTSHPELPPKLPEDSDPELLKARARDVAMILIQHRRDKSKAYRAIAQLLWARRFRNDPKLYFPHNVDTRGRVYQIPYQWGPQTDDVGKALVTFAHGKRLGASGLRWWKIHGANVWGADKLPLDERVAWVDENAAMIRETCLDPRGSTAWHDADKPWQFLAWASEWEHVAEHGPEAVSRIPVALDATCSGLQHFSALLRDRVGATATNLCDEPQHDIYTEVLGVTKGLLEDGLSKSEWAGPWLRCVDRSVVKQPTMTTPYGVTHYGIREQIYHKVRTDPKKYWFKENATKTDLGMASAYLANVVTEAIGTVVKASTEAKAWLDECALILAEHNAPIVWTTPSGFTWVQEYRKVNTDKMLRVRLLGRERDLCVKYSDPQPSDPIHKSRTRSGISPNFIHSLDAAHLTLAVNQAAQGTDLAVVHDSFGTHACDAEALRDVLRSVFVEVYDRDLLGDLRASFQARVPRGVEIPEPPELGAWDLKECLGSSYMFN